MGYRVVSRFHDRSRGVYVDPGAPCPALLADEATRLVAARCLVEVADESPPAPTPRRKRDVPAPADTPAPTE